MNKFSEICNAIKNDPKNAEYTSAGIEPLYLAHPESRICFIVQTPGRIAEENSSFWLAASARRLSDWTGISLDDFENSRKISFLPMDFYYPGRGKSGDLPPRKGFAEKWHPQLFGQMPDLKLFILVGSYAQKYYLELKPSDKMTDVIRNYQKYLPNYFPIVHPSARNNIWLAKNSWFEQAIVPELKKIVRNSLADSI